MPTPKESTTDSGTAASSTGELVPVVVLRDEPPPGASPLAVTTFVKRNMNAPARTREDWLKAYATWFAGSTPKAEGKE